MRDKLGDEIRLLHIRDAIIAIFEYINDADFDAFTANRMLYDACCRQLEILGESANHISGQMQAGNPEIDWAKIVAFRNVVAHQYFGLDERTIWDIIQFHLPLLRRQVEKLVGG